MRIWTGLFGRPLPPPSIREKAPSSISGRTPVLSDPARVHSCRPAYSWRESPLDS